jgi:cell shape-determining protein MreD
MQYFAMRPRYFALVVVLMSLAVPFVFGEGTGAPFLLGAIIVWIYAMTQIRSR